MDSIKRFCNIINYQVPDHYYIYLSKNSNIIIKNCDLIFNKYITTKKINKKLDDITITYYKRIPVKYWHLLYNFYFDLNEIYKRKLFVDKNQKTIIRLYINIIPSLVDFEIIKKKNKFNFFESIYYNHFFNMANN